MKRAVLAALALATPALLPGCARHARSAPEGSVVVCEAPAAVPADGEVLARHPAGSRVSLVAPGGSERRILSKGLFAAGEPAVTPDGERVLFSGKARAGDAWQIWEASLDGNEPRPLTSLPGGATSPALLADGTAVFVAPASGDAIRPAALFTLAPGSEEARRLTFGTTRVSDPTVLADGRILFVSRQPDGSREALFAVNDDGTGVTSYACNHEGAPFVARPREEAERVLFAAWDAPGAPVRGESVLSARPWRSRSVFDAPAPPPVAAPGWTVVEAVPLAPRQVVRRRVSTVDPTKKTGFLLCLDANRSGDGASGPAASARVTTVDAQGPRTLGEVPVAPDGSFLAEVPADVPLGIETLDGNGGVLRSLAPFIWVRPGETRGCIGCHEPHGTAPRNHRPLAVKIKAAKLDLYGGVGG